MKTERQRPAPLAAAARMIVVSLAVAGAVLGLAPGVAHAQDYFQQIKAPTGGGSFGQVMATDGTTLVVGDPGYQNSGAAGCPSQFGSVSIYKLTGGAWQLSQSLTSTTPPDDNENYTLRFGSSVSLRNNVLVIGSPGEDSGTGAFFVYRRTSPTAAFTFLAELFDPIGTDLEGQYTLYGGVATNGTYIAAPEGTAGTGNINVYQIQGNNVVHVSTVNVAPIASSVSSMVITTSNALVLVTEGDAGGPQTPLAFQLNGTQATPITSMANTFESGADITPIMAGDGNTVVVIKVAFPSDGGNGYYYPQVIKFGAAGVVSFQSMSLPWAYAHFESFASSGPGPIVMKENQGFFIGYQNAPGEFGQSSFLAGYRYLASTGDYYPAGVVRNDLFHYPYTNFAAAVAYDGTYLYMGDPGETWTAANGCSPEGAVGAVDVLRPLTSVPTGPSGSKELEPWLSESTLNMGQSVATNGTYVLAGAWEDPDATTDWGEATLFGNFSNQWTEIQRYTDPNGGIYGNFLEASFGTSVDVDANFLAIGAPLAETGSSGLQTGAVYVGFGPPYSIGPLLTELDPPSTAPAGTWFGQSVGLAGTTLVVGAPASSSVGGTGLPTRGAVYVYTYQTTTRSFGLTQTLHPTGAGDSDHENFGWTVDIDSSAHYIIVGIPNRPGSTAPVQGAVQIFTLVNGAFVSGGEFLAPSNFPPRANLGTAVSIGANYAVAGSRVAGAVMVFRRTGNTWVQDTVIQPFTFGFGTALALDGTRFAVGSPSENRVYRYERINNVWQRTATLTSTSGTGTFGASLDTKNGVLAIGDYNALTGTTTSTTSGAAYVISLTGF